MKEPIVTVMMSVYNGARYLREAIDSVLSQTFRDFELLIVNDGSSDDSVEIAGTYADPRIRLVHNDGNIGVTASRNRGLRLARAEYIACMDQDDISLSTRLEKQVRYMNENPMVGVCGAGASLIDSQGKGGATIMFPGDPATIKWHFCFTSPFAHPTIMMRKSLILAAGGYSDTWAEDYDLWWRLSSRTEFFNLQEVLLRLRKHEENFTKVHFSDHAVSVARISATIISDRLGEVTSPGLIHRFNCGQVSAVEDAVSLGGIILRLARSFLRESGTSHSARDYIRRDAARKLLVLARPFLSDVRIYPVVVQGLRLDPLLPFTAALSRLGRQ